MVWIFPFYQVIDKWKLFLCYVIVFIIHEYVIQQMYIILLMCFLWDNIPSPVIMRQPFFSGTSLAIHPCSWSEVCSSSFFHIWKRIPSGWKGANSSYPLGKPGGTKAFTIPEKNFTLNWLDVAIFCTAVWHNILYMGLF